MIILETSPRFTRSVPAVVNVTLPVNVVLAETVRDVADTVVFDAIVSVLSAVVLPPLRVVALSCVALKVPDT